jgi:hypothetical protein
MMGQLENDAEIVIHQEVESLLSSSLPRSTTRCKSMLLGVGCLSPVNNQNLTLSLIHRFNDHTSRLLY